MSMATWIYVIAGCRRVSNDLRLSVRSPGGSWWRCIGSVRWKETSVSSRKCVCRRKVTSPIQSPSTYHVHIICRQCVWVTISQAVRDDHGPEASGPVVFTAPIWKYRTSQQTKLEKQISVPKGDEFFATLWCVVLIWMMAFIICASGEVQTVWSASWFQDKPPSPASEKKSQKQFVSTRWYVLLLSQQSNFKTRANAFRSGRWVSPLIGFAIELHPVLFCRGYI